MNYACELDFDFRWTMDANGGNMVKKLQKEIHVQEPIIVAQLPQDVQWENRYEN